MASVTSASLPVVSSVVSSRYFVHRFQSLRSSEANIVGRLVLVEPACATFDPQPTETHPKKQVANIILRNLTSSKIVFRINCR